jgi:hypothetical protein
MNPTDTLLNAWKRWLAYQFSKNPSAGISSLTVQLRDSESAKTYPGIYLEEGAINRVESGGIKDSNCWQIEVKTMLVSTPCDEDQLGTTKEAHDALKADLSPIVNDCQAEDWLSTQIGIVCQQFLTSSPVTTDQGGYRVTTWSNEIVICAV